VNTRFAAGSVLIWLALAASPSAHRLDEYLQASRLLVARDRITLELDVTPGANIAGRVVALVDRNADGRISPLEAEAYGRVVLAAIHLDVDGRDIPLALSRVEASSIPEMNEGLGSVQMVAVGSLPKPVSAGRHEVYFRNDHRPESAAYLVNALVPANLEIAVVGQRRDVQQREIRIDFVVGPAWPVKAAWIVLGLSGLMGLVLVRKVRPPAGPDDRRRP
jgi:hypothetical protein